MEAGAISHDTLSKRKENFDKEVWAQSILGRYKSHTKEALMLTSQKEFSLFKFNDHRKSLYLFNPKDVSTKYSCKFESTKNKKGQVNDLYSTAKETFKMFLE